MIWPRTMVLVCGGFGNGGGFDGGLRWLWLRLNYGNRRVVSIVVRAKAVVLGC